MIDKAIGDLESILEILILIQESSNNGTLDNIQLGKLLYGAIHVLDDYIDFLKKAKEQLKINKIN